MKLTTMQMLQTVGGLIALGLSIPTFISGNYVMAIGLIAVGCVIVGINLKNGSE